MTPTYNEMHGLLKAIQGYDMPNIARRTYDSYATEYPSSIKQMAAYAIWLEIQATVLEASVTTHAQRVVVLEAENAALKAQVQAQHASGFSDHMAAAVRGSLA